MKYLCQAKAKLGRKIWSLIVDLFRRWNIEACHWPLSHRQTPWSISRHILIRFPFSVYGIDDHHSLGFSPPSCEMWDEFVAYHFLLINITVWKVFKPCHGSTFERKNEIFSLYMSFCLVIIQHGIYMSDIFVWVPITVVWLQLGRFLEEIQNEVVGNFLIERSLGVSDESYPERHSYASCKSDEESMVSFHKCGSERSYYSPFICTVKRRISLGTTWRHLCPRVFALMSV